ncbi:MAG TPA: hypothetical protein VEA60_06550 [Allosphingosinicella sp.]|nr:hypothetical protein [Allosphingosinicella sp.]
MSIKLIFASTAALALIAGAPAHAAKNESVRALAAADGAAGAKAKEERKTCRYFDNTASRMKRERLCLTREQWKKFEEQQAQ